MRISIAVLLAITSIAPVCFAQSSVVTLPEGRVTAGLAIPIAVQFPGKGATNFDVRVTSNGNKLLDVNVTGNLSLSAVSSRFQAVDPRVSVDVLTPDNGSNKTDKTLDLPAPAVIHDDRDSSTAIIAQKPVTFIRSGKEVFQRSVSNKFSFYIKNAVSRAHYVNEVVVELVKGESKSIVKINGSPYWYEPLMIIDGDFDSGSVVSVIAN